MSTLKSYSIGYILSVLMTFAAFGILLLHFHTQHTFPTHQMLVIGFVTLAILQMFVQLFFFLHLGRKEKTHWNVAVLGFALFAVFAVVGGTLWIINNLNAHMTQDTFINGQINVQNEND